MNSSTEEPCNDLTLIDELVYREGGIGLSNFKKELESAEYDACEFQIKDKFCKFRSAQITPTKIGFFATIWKRIGAGPIMPYAIEDSVDEYVFSVRDEEHFGVFTFPKEILVQKGILSKNRKSGKRAFRLYPSWVETKSRTAQKSQSWQVKYFLDLSEKK